jgi:protein SCO1/2
MERRTLWVGIGLLVLIGATGLYFLLTRDQQFHAAVIDPPLPAADIQLTDYNGQSYQMASQRGKIILVFFGYTNCPDECPLTMAKLSQVFESLGDQTRDIQVLFVTTDPARDTPEQLKNYLANFNSDFLGLTGTREELQKTWSDYGVAVLDNGGTHSTRVYVIDQEGNLRMTFLYEMAAVDIASDLRLLLKGN